jgi:hypothetical protein
MGAEILSMAVGGSEADTLWTDFLRRPAWLGLGADRLGQRFLACRSEPRPCAVSVLPHPGGIVSEYSQRG